MLGMVWRHVEGVGGLGQSTQQALLSSHTFPLLSRATVESSTFSGVSVVLSIVLLSTWPIAGALTCIDVVDQCVSTLVYLFQCEMML